MKLFCYRLVGSLLLVGAIGYGGTDAAAEILRLKLNDQITPASAEVITSAIENAESRQAAAIIIMLNTPGGLDTSMREIVSRIVASKVPVVIYVAPSGARAASAGFVILLASDLAAMAPGTATGAAHPVLGGGQEMEKTMAEKVVNDAAAYVRSLAEKRNRNAEAAEATIRESRSFTEREALDNKLIEIIAGDEFDLLAQMDGRSIIRFDGSQVSLEIQDVPLVEFTPSLRQRLLMALADPRIAFVLFAIGALCVYFEFQNPGGVVPGVIGALAIVLGLYGFHMLPINVTGVVLIGLAIALFVLEVQVQGFGILGLGGIVAAVIGSLILIDVPNPELRLPLGLVLGVVVPFGVIFIVMLRLALRSRHAKVSMGSKGMIGLRGRAETPIEPYGTIFVAGELWQARSKMRIAKGETVLVTDLDGLTLEVEAETDDSIEPRKTSALNGQ